MKFLKAVGFFLGLAVVLVILGRSAHGSMLWLTPGILAAYFLPSVLAAVRHHHNTGAILLLNVLAGWTIIGWIIALVWAATTVQPQTQVTT